MKVRWKIATLASLIIITMLTIIVFVSSSNQQSSVKIVNDIELMSDSDDMQSSWACDSHNFARAENGYYFMADNGKSLMYFDMVTNEVVPVCAKPDCSHDDYNCNSYLGLAEYLLFSVYYYDGHVYLLKDNMGKVQLTQISQDGASRKAICDVFTTDGGNSYDVVFHDNKAYIYDHCGNFIDNNANTESQVSIKSVDLSTGEISDIYSVTGVNIGFCNARSYGDNLFFIIRQAGGIIGENGASASDLMKNKGVYAYNYKTGQTRAVMEGNICDYAMDEENELIYYFESGKGLYSLSLSDKNEIKELYSAEKDCMECNMSYDGTYLYLDNTDWAASNTKGNGMSCRVISRDGTLINRIYNPWNGYGEIYFGDENYMFSLFSDYDSNGNPVGTTIFWYIPKEDVGTTSEWRRLTEQPIRLLNEDLHGM